VKAEVTKQMTMRKKRVTAPKIIRVVEEQVKEPLKVPHHKPPSLKDRLLLRMPSSMLEKLSLMCKL